MIVFTFFTFSGLGQLASWGGGMGALGTGCSVLPELHEKDRNRQALLLLVRGAVLVQGSKHSRHGAYWPTARDQLAGRTGNKGIRRARSLPCQSLSLLVSSIH